MPAILYPPFVVAEPLPGTFQVNTRGNLLKGESESITVPDTFQLKQTAVIKMMGVCVDKYGIG